MAITVWKDGTWKKWDVRSAELAQDDENWLLTIKLEYGHGYAWRVPNTEVA